MQNKVIRKETYPFAWAPRNPPSLKIRRNISLLSGLSQSDVGTPPRHIKQANKGVSISSVFLSRIGVYWKEEFKKNHKHITKKRRPFSVLLLLLTVGLRWPLIRYWVSTQNCQRITIKSQHFYIHLHTHIHILHALDESLERNDKEHFFYRGAW